MLAYELPRLIPTNGGSLLPLWGVTGAGVVVPVAAAEASGATLPARVGVPVVDVPDFLVCWFFFLAMLMDGIQDDQSIDKKL